jgi:spermidine dehydrogenase
MVRAPIRHKIPDMTIRDHYRAGRYQLLETPFSEIETATKAQLMDLYGRYGFDAERDIEAITVNRWSHGYAYTYSELDDPDFEKGAFPHEIGRRKFGRISIANSDSEARAYLDAAIDSAWRAVTEQLA